MATTIRLASNVVICTLLAVGLAACSSGEESRQAPKKQEKKATYELVSPVSNVRCSDCTIHNCGVSCDTCDNGLEYDCMTNVTVKAL